MGGSSLSDIRLLKHMTNLQTLELSGTKVYDITPLKELTNLKSLHLDETKVSKEQIEELKKALPNCKIFYNK